MMSSSSSSLKNSSSSSSPSSFSTKPIANHYYNHYNDDCSSNSKRFRSNITEPISTSWSNNLEMSLNCFSEKKISTDQIFEPFVPTTTTKRFRREQSDCCVVTTTRTKTIKDNAAATSSFVEGRKTTPTNDSIDSRTSCSSIIIDDDSCCSRSRHLYSSPSYVSTSNSDNELINNGDSGFQELQIPDDCCTSVSIDNNKNINLNDKMDDAIDNTDSDTGPSINNNNNSMNQMTMTITKSASVAGESPNNNSDNTMVDLISEQQQQQLNHSSSSSSSSNSNLNNEDNAEEDDDDVENDNDNDADADDNDSISELSYASDLSNMSGEDWKPINKNIEWIQRQIANGSNPKEIIEHLTGSQLIGEIDNVYAWRLLIRMLSEPSVRSKLNHINTIDDVIDLIQNSKNIIVLTGAGVSVSCGIPDFRSRNGVYARLSKDFPDLPDPQSMFDIHYFRKNPYPFFKFAKEIYPGQFQPSPSHKFIKYLEIEGRLLRNYSQNIDTLEQTAGIKNVITCHGSFATATCTVCGFRCDSNSIRNEIFAQQIPLCSQCAPKNNNNNNILYQHQISSQSSLSSSIFINNDHDDDKSRPDNVTGSSFCNQNLPVMKPDIVFFGEGLSDEFHNSMTVDKDQCDLLIVIGSSLKVRPVALIPSSIPENIPQILINREPLNHLNFDVELLGDCDVIVKYLCERLGTNWSQYCFSHNNDDANERFFQSNNVEEQQQQQQQSKEFEFIAPSRYIFKGAELNDTFDSDSDNDSDGNDGDDVANDSFDDNDDDDTNDEILIQSNHQQSQNNGMIIDTMDKMDVTNNSLNTNDEDVIKTNDDDSNMMMINDES